MHQFLPMANPIIVLGAVAAGTSDTQTFTEVSMSPQYPAILFIALLGTITSTGLATLEAKGSNTSGTYGSGTVGLFEHADTGIIVQANASTGDSNTAIAIDIYKPLVPYVRGQVVRATANVVISACLAIQYDSTVQQVYTYTGLASHGASPTSPAGTNNGWDYASNVTMSTT